jgi:hypothetical protein
MAENQAPHRAGLFDIRFIIGALIGTYGVILVISGLFTSDKQLEKADGLNINLYAGIGMVVVAVAFGVWARVRPIVVPADVEAADDGGSDRPAE